MAAQGHYFECCVDLALKRAVLDPGVGGPLIRASPTHLDFDLVVAWIPGFSHWNRAGKSGEFLQLKVAESLFLPELQLVLRSGTLTAAHHLCEVPPWMVCNPIAGWSANPCFQFAFEAAASAWHGCRSRQLRLLLQPLFESLTRGWLSLQWLHGQLLQLVMHLLNWAGQGCGQRPLVAAAVLGFHAVQRLAPLLV